MKPDYGLRLMQEGASRDVDIFLYDFAIFSITVLGRGQYSAFAERQHNGEWFAVSLDFAGPDLDAILAAAQPLVRQAVQRELSRDPSTPRAIDLAEAIRVAVRARLGRPQRNSNETFVPLVCQEVLHSSGTASNEAPNSWTITIPRSAVEACEPSGTLRAIRDRVETTRNPRELCHRLELRFSGYDTDSRELWHIQEVRQFVSALDRDFPFWFYVADLKTDFLKVLAFCLCRVSTPRPGATAIHPNDFAEFLERHFGAMNQLLDHWSVGTEENERVSNEVLAYFRRAQIAN